MDTLLRGPVPCEHPRISVGVIAYFWANYEEYEVACAVCGAQLRTFSGSSDQQKALEDVADGIERQTGYRPAIGI